MSSTVAGLKQGGFRKVQTFSGPPGSGKTKRAKRLIEALKANGEAAVIVENDDGTETVWARKDKK